MYDENMLIDLGGENYGEQIIRTVSEPDSYFPESLTLYDDIVSANIVATDDYGYRPDEYEISVPALGYAFIHAPYNIEISGGGTMILYNPPRLLKISLKNGDVHYFPFSGADREDTKTSYEKEVADLFDDKYKDIKILREAAKAMKLIEGLSEDVEEYEYDKLGRINLHFEQGNGFIDYLDQIVYANQIRYYFFEDIPIDFFPASPEGDRIPEFEKEGETRIKSFMNAMKWLAESNRKRFIKRTTEFIKYVSEEDKAEDNL